MDRLREVRVQMAGVVSLYCPAWSARESEQAAVTCKSPWGYRRVARQTAASAGGALLGVCPPPLQQMVPPGVCFAVHRISIWDFGGSLVWEPAQA